MGALARSLNDPCVEELDTATGAAAIAGSLAGIAADLGGLSDLINLVYFSHIASRLS